MDKFVPPEIADLIASIEASQDEEFQKRKRAEEAEAARLRKIEELRQHRSRELYPACVRIKEWIHSFKEAVGPAIWRLNGGAGIVVFTAKFFHGEPTPPGDATCSAQLRLHDPTTTKRLGTLVYEELLKGRVSSERPLLGTVDSLFHFLHPDFVAQCDAHLSGPDAWKYVRQTLQQLRLAALTRR